MDNLSRPGLILQIKDVDSKALRNKGWKGS